MRTNACTQAFHLGDDLDGLAVTERGLRRHRRGTTLSERLELGEVHSGLALDEVLPRDGQGNTGRGDTLAVDARGNLLFADQGTIAVLGVEDLVVVRTGDAVLVMPKARSQEVRRIVNELTARGRGNLL